MGHPDTHDSLLQALVEAVEEAVIASLFHARTVMGFDGHLRKALPLDETLAILRRLGLLT